MRTKVLVTGAKGQLAKTIADLVVANIDAIDFTFVSKSELDITNTGDVQTYFKEHKFNYCINCAAYTNVEQAEQAPEIAFDVNAEGVKNIAEACIETNTILIHISTDYVFDGEKSTPYTVDDLPNPINEYGKSKLLGEQHIQEILQHYFIIRTSWLYSEYGNNFVKTMMRLGKERDELSIVNDQIGSPTYARDLVKVIFEIINSGSDEYGVYHYSNDGKISWYDFAIAIFKIKRLNVVVTPVQSIEYRTDTKRPEYTLLSKTKIRSTLNIEAPIWSKSLNIFLKNYT